LEVHPFQCQRAIRPALRSRKHTSGSEFVSAALAPVDPVLGPYTEAAFAPETVFVQIREPPDGKVMPPPGCTICPLSVLCEEQIALQRGIFIHDGE
jgi:hypothetical protein